METNKGPSKHGVVKYPDIERWSIFVIFRQFLEMDERLQLIFATFQPRDEMDVSIELFQLKLLD